MPSRKQGRVRSLSRLIFAVTALLVCSLLMAPSAAWAHKVNVFAYVEGDTVVTESYFSDGRKCRDSLIEVFDPEGRKLLEGKTDAEGRFSFRPPLRSDLLIRLSAAMGHRAEYTVPATDLPVTITGGPPSAPEPVNETIESLSEKSGTEPAQGKSTPQQQLAPVDVEALVEHVVARQLAPIRRALEESQDRRRISDIVGGIGYIIGLMGVVLYFHARRRGG